MEAGEEFGIRPFGIRAMTAMSIEKSYRLIPRELSIEYSAYESGLDRFVHPNKGEFLGRDALVDGHARRVRNWNFVTMEVHGVTDADARGSEPIYRERQAGRPRHQWRLRLAGRTSRWRSRMVRPEHAGVGTELEIKILGELYQGDGDRGKPVRPGQSGAEGDKSPLRDRRALVVRAATIRLPAPAPLAGDPAGR